MTTVFDPTTGVREIEREYLSCAETAKLLRVALKTAFPGVKFSVRSSVYSGGASISVGYTDGPPQATVTAVAERYAGAGFDGMIDLKTYNEDWLLPDGTVAPCRSEIGHSYRSDAQTPQPAPSADARLVHFGADYVFVTRDLSRAAEEVVLAAMVAANPQMAGADVDDHTALYPDVCVPDGDGWRVVTNGSVGGNTAAECVRQAAASVTFA